MIKKSRKIKLFIACFAIVFLFNTFQLMNPDFLTIITTIIVSLVESLIPYLIIILITHIINCYSRPS